MPKQKKSIQKKFFIPVLIGSVLVVSMGVLLNFTNTFHPVEPKQSTEREISTTPEDIFYKQAGQPTPRVYKPALTDATVIPGWKKYIDPYKGYSFEFPADWEMVVREVKDGKHLYSFFNVKFMVDNKPYYFTTTLGRDYPPSWISEKKSITVANELTTVITWYENGKPVHMSLEYSPKSEIPAFIMDLPAMDTDQYREIFYHILNTFQLNK